MDDFWRETFLEVLGELDIIAHATGEFGDVARATLKLGDPRTPVMFLALGRLQDVRTRLAKLRVALNELVLE